MRLGDPPVTPARLLQLPNSDCLNFLVYIYFPGRFSAIMGSANLYKFGEVFSTNQARDPTTDAIAGARSLSTVVSISVPILLIRGAVYRWRRSFARNTSSEDSRILKYKVMPHKR